MQGEETVQPQVNTLTARPPDAAFGQGSGPAFPHREATRCLPIDSPSSFAPACQCPTPITSPHYSVHNPWEDCSTLTSRDPAAACRPGSGPAFCLWPAPPHLPVTSPSSSTHACPQPDPHPWPSLQCACPGERIQPQERTPRTRAPSSCF